MLGRLPEGDRSAGRSRGRIRAMRLATDGSPATTRVSPARFYALIAGIAGLYFLGGRVGLEVFGLLHPSASAVWPPTGVAIAALLVFGHRVWPAVFVGAFLVNLTTAGAIVTSLGIATGNTLEAVAAAFLVARFAHGQAAFAHALDIVKFAGLAAVLSTAVSATIGVSVLTIAGMAPADQFDAIWLTWWLGDASGAILVTPFLLCWYRDHALRWTGKRALEAALLFATVIVVTAALFFEPVLGRYPLAFLCLPPLVWAAFRFEQREVVTAVVMMSVVATWATTIGRGPFAMATPNESLLVLQSFMTMIAMTAVVMAALVQERVALLERERLALANAEAALRSSDAFLAMLSHELRNPLSAIAAAGAVLEQPGGPARAGRIIERQTAHLTRLIDDLLDVARITAGKMALHRRPVDLAEAASSALQAIQPREVRERPRVELHLDHVWVDADPDRLNQIITNLLHNSLKYTAPDGCIRISTLAEGDRGVLEIEDTGVGIASDLLPRVFELFTQGEQGPDRAHGGLGVGLALVRRLVDLHAGAVEARSPGPGRGSTFVVRLPLAAAPASSVASSKAGASFAGAYRILIVEDNADARESLRMLLQMVGHEVLEARDGETGVESALEFEPRVALVDIGLPGIDGYEVARRIKAVKPAIRLIALTGYGRDEDKERSRQAGFDAHLLKPVELQTLCAVMEELLASERHIAARASP